MAALLPPNSNHPDRSKSILAITSEYLPDWPYFEDLYKYLHQNPELSKQEEETSKLVATHLYAGGYEVKANIGGYGVAGVRRNGTGPTVMLCAQMDALPMLEETGLPYSSEKRAIGEDGQECPVMHACGHDMNIAVLLATSTFFAQANEYWFGTIICLFQPSDEVGGGALAMVNDWLYAKVPVPDIILAPHVTGIKAGSVAIGDGSVIPGSESYSLCILGEDGEGAKPRHSVNPILIGSRIINGLAKIVKTKIPPGEFGDIDLTFIHAGDAENVVPNHLDMELAIKYKKPKVGKAIDDEVRKVINAECKAAKLSKHPVLTVVSSSVPIIDDQDPVVKLRAIFKDRFADEVHDSHHSGIPKEHLDLIRPHKTSYAHWFFGSMSQETWEEALKAGKIDEMYMNKSNRFAPVIQPTLRTGTEACALAALSFLTIKVPNFEVLK